MRALPHPTRLLPLTWTVAALLLIVKLVGLANALGGNFATAAMPIAEARAEATAPPPASPAHGASAANSAGSTTGAVHTDAGRPEGNLPAAQPPALDKSASLPSPKETEILEQLAERRRALEAREQDTERRSDLLRAAETRLDQKLREMKDLQGTLERLLKANDEQQLAKLRSLVKIYENMKPKDAARIFQELDMDTLLPVAERMNERKLAPVMAEMNPAKAKEITQELGKRRQVISGERPDGKS